MREELNVDFFSPIYLGQNGTGFQWKESLDEMNLFK